MLKTRYDLCKCLIYGLVSAAVYVDANVKYVCVQELKVLQINTEGQVKVLETDVQAARVTVAALKEINKDLGEI